MSANKVTTANPLDAYRKARDASGFGTKQEFNAQKIVDSLVDGNKNGNGDLTRQVQYLRLFNTKSQEQQIAKVLKDRGHGDLAKELSKPESQIKQNLAADQRAEYSPRPKPVRAPDKPVEIAQTGPEQPVERLNESTAVPADLAKFLKEYEAANSSGKSFEYEKLPDFSPTPYGTKYHF